MVPLAAGTGEARLLLDPLRRWEIVATAEGFWSPVVAVPPGSSPPIRLTLWPAAHVVGRLEPPEGEDPVRRVGLRLARASDGPENDDLPLTAEIVCTVEDRRTTDCHVPVGRWHLRVEAPGFAPHFLWNQTVQEPEGLDLGQLKLRRGGSLVGQVITSEGPADPRHASVELRPVFDRRPTGEEEERQLEQLTRSVAVNAWGFFQFVGVKSGTYHIEAQQPGYVEVIRSRVTVVAPEATELKEPLVLRAPVHLTVRVEPVAGPFGDPWSLRLHGSDGSQVLEMRAEGETGPAGSWRSPPLPPGQYSLEVVGGDGNRMAWRELTLGDGDEQVDVDLPLVYVEGQVLLDEEPLQATVWFGGRTGAERVETESDEDGELYLVLPREGDWTVDVAAEEPAVASRGLEVEAEPDGTHRLAEVLIQVPDTSVVGEVVDELGAPVAEAHVRFSSFGDWRGVLGTSTNDLGLFELHGMRPGPYSAEAERGDRRSEPVLLTVDEGLSPSVRLTLRQERPMAGRVLSESGPVPEARIIAYPVTGTGQPATMRIPEARTDVEGRFRLSVPGSTSRVRLLVLAPGYSLGVREVSEGERLQVRLSRGGGLLRLVPPDRDPEASEVGIVLVQGEPLDLPRLTAWARINGSPPGEDGALAIPAMPPGRYAFCRMRLDEALLVMGEAAVPAADACSTGHLAPGGELVLEAPS